MTIQDVELSNNHLNNISNGYLHSNNNNVGPYSVMESPYHLPKRYDENEEYEAHENDPSNSPVQIDVDTSHLDTIKVESVEVSENESEVEEEKEVKVTPKRGGSVSMSPFKRPPKKNSSIKRVSQPVANKSTKSVARSVKKKRMT